MDSIRFLKYNIRKNLTNPKNYVALAFAFFLNFINARGFLEYVWGVPHNIHIFEIFIVFVCSEFGIIFFVLELLIMIGDAPFVEPGVFYYTIRSNKRSWFTGQIIYVAAATICLILFNILASILLAIAAGDFFVTDIWSYIMSRIVNLGTSNVGMTLSWNVSYVDVTQGLYPVSATLIEAGLLLLLGLFVGLWNSFFKLIRQDKLGYIMLFALILGNFIVGEFPMLDILFKYISPFSLAVITKLDFGYSTEYPSLLYGVISGSS
jgi:hypothetical protein